MNKITKILLLPAVSAFFLVPLFAHASATITIGSLSASNGNSISVPVTVSDFGANASTTGFTFHINFDNTKLSYTGFSDALAFVAGPLDVEVSSGSIIAIANGDSVLIPDGTILFKLNFTVTEPTNITTTIAFTGENTISDEINFETIPGVAWVDGTITLNPGSAPSVPTSFATSSLTGTSVNFSWAAPSFNGGSVITGYYFQKYDTVANATTSTFYASTTLATSSAGLISGRAYRFSVSAVNAVGTSSPSVINQTMPTVPSTPTSFATSSPVVYNSASLTWVAPSNGGSAITGYYFEVVTGGSTTTSALLSSATFSTTTALSGSTAYTFYVSAVNIVGTSTPATISLTTPGAPTAPTAPTSFATSSVTYTTIGLTWAAPSSNGGSAVTGYYFQQFNGSATTSTMLSSATFSTTTTGLTGGLGYRFTLSAINAIGTGTPVVLNQTTTAPSAPTPPTSFATTSLTGTSVGLSWAAPSSDNGSSITGYYFQVFNGSATTSTLLSNATLSTTSTGLANGTAYRFTLSAVNGVGTSTGVVLNQTTPSTPTAPTSFATSSVTYTTIGLTWAAPSSNGGSAVTGYYFQQFNGSATTSTMLSSATFSTTTTGLTGGLGYRFTLSAINAIGTGTPVVLNQTTTAPSAPTPPTSFATSTLTGTSVIFTWGVPVDNNGSLITGYYFQKYDTVANATTSTMLSSATLSTTTTSLVNGRAYRFTLSAVNSLGTSTTVVINQTMPAVPGIPSSLATSTMTYSTALLTWTAPASNGASITDYLIQYSTGGATTTWTHDASTATSATVTGLSGGTSYIFAVSATNIAGTGAAAYITGVTPATPPTVSITASPTTISSGSASNITWSSTNASTCTTTKAGVDWAFTTSGSQTSGPLTASTIFAISCTGQGGSASASATVGMASSGGNSSGGGGRYVPFTPTMTITASSTSVVSGASTMINWNSSIIGSCFITKAGVSWYVGTSTSGSKSSGPITAPTTFSALCGGSTGVAYKTVTVNVIGVSQGQFNTNLSMGMTHTDVARLQQFLNGRGYIVSSTGMGSVGKESNYFGLKTQQALIKFQKNNNVVPPNGKFGPITRGVVNSLLNGSQIPTTVTTIPTPAIGTTTDYVFVRNLKLGATGADVKALQVYLNSHGSPVALSGQGSIGNESNYFGPATQKALAKFQREHNISPAEGYFGLITRTFINNN
jgi:hypothetical protein